jgi:hypothetical protein
VDISAALAADLAAVAKLLDDPHFDLETRPRDHAADLKRAVAAYIGVTMTITVDGHEISFTTGDSADTAAAASALESPFTALNAAEEGSSLVVYAAAAAVFVDLATDLSFVLNIGPAALVLDERAAHRSGAGHDRPGMRGVDEFSRINRAIGILLARGHTPETARLELHRLGLDAREDQRSREERQVTSRKRGAPTRHSPASEHPAWRNQGRRPQGRRERRTAATRSRPWARGDLAA